MQNIKEDLFYLLACGANEKVPESSRVQSYKQEQSEAKLRQLYQLSRAHFVDALVGTVLKQAGVTLPVRWEQSIAKAIRKEILFDAEREKIFAFMEQKKIWYLPLKGIVLKHYYPAVGLRQMSDNDILFEETFAQTMKDYMQSQGYVVESYGRGNHDVYEKAPVYNFELHRALYGATSANHWADYYRDIKSRLVPEKENSYCYRMKAEDFYIYLMCHAAKHYQGSGTGVRTLLDFYIYLQKETALDFDYIERECETLAIAQFEKDNRVLCKKVFGEGGSVLAANEQEMLDYYLASGVYGNQKQRVDNRLKTCRNKKGQISKWNYIRTRLFPGKEYYQHFPFFARHRVLLPLLYLFRMVIVVCDPKRRKNVWKECKLVKGSKK